MTGNGTSGSRSEARSLYFVLGVAVFLRLLVTVIALATTEDYSNFYHPDVADYVNLAHSLVNEGRFEQLGRPELFRVPAYPLLLIPGIILGYPYAVTFLLQILLSCVTVYLVYRIGTLVFQDERVGVAGALLYAMEPLSILYCSDLLTETLFTACNTWFLYHLVRYLRTWSFTSLVCAALAVTASSYVRPGSIYLPILVAGFLVVLVLMGRGRRGILWHVPAFLALCVVLLVPWTIRNIRTAHYPGFSTVFDWNAYFMYRPALLLLAGESPEIVSEDEKRLLSAREKGTISEGEFHKAVGKKGAEVLLANWPYAVTLTARGTVSMFLAPSVASPYLDRLNIIHLKFRQEQPGEAMRDRVIGFERGIRRAIEVSSPGTLVVRVVSGLYYYAYLLLFVGAFVSREVRRNLLIIALLLVSCYLWIVTAAVGAARYRHPIMPVVCVVAGYSLRHALDWLRNRRAVGLGATR
jgi:hypothetical protein